MFPLPAGLSGWVTTPAIGYPAVEQRMQNRNSECSGSGKNETSRRGRDYLSHSPCFTSLRIFRLMMSRLMKLR